MQNIQKGSQLDIRKDLESVAAQISRLISIGQQFKEFDKEWSHLKNNEDFRFVFKLPEDKRYKVEEVYSDGRDMAIYMSESLLSINYDFGKYPTLTSVIESFEGTWVYGNYDHEVPDTAQSICKEHGVTLWSTGQMIKLFKKQEQLLAAVRVTIQILKESELYKLENNIPIMKKEKIINLNGISGSNININSPGAIANISQNYETPPIFEEMINSIKLQNLDQNTQSRLIDNVQALAVSHQNGSSFKDAYKDFIQNTSAYITIFSPFIAGLSSFL